MFEEMKEELRDILDVPEGEALLPELAKTVACLTINKYFSNNPSDS